MPLYVFAGLELAICLIYPTLSMSHKSIKNKSMTIKVIAFLVVLILTWVIRIIILQVILRFRSPLSDSLFHFFNIALVVVGVILLFKRKFKI